MGDPGQARMTRELKLVFVGKEDYFYIRLKQKVKEMGLQKNVEFKGEVNDEELSKLYHHAVALINPSLMEGFGLPVVEAMANGCLVVISDIPIFKEICDNAAIYFDPRSIEDIALKLRLLSYNDRTFFQNNIEQGLKRVKQFSWEEMARNTLKIYNEIKQT